MNPALPSIAETHRRPARLDSARSSMIALLILVVLFAQWMGLQHRIEHARWLDNPAIGQQGDDDADASTEINRHDASAPSSNSLSQVGKASVQKPHHSCLLFDDATLGNTIAIVPLTLPPPTCARELALWLAFTSWDAPLTRFFSSRAPPAP